MFKKINDLLNDEVYSCQTIPLSYFGAINHKYRMKVLNACRQTECPIESL